MDPPPVEKVNAFRAETFRSLALVSPPALLAPERLELVADIGPEKRPEHVFHVFRNGIRPQRPDRLFHGIVDVEGVASRIDDIS